VRYGQDVDILIDWRESKNDINYDIPDKFDAVISYNIAG